MLYTYDKFVQKTSYPMVKPKFRGAIGFICTTCKLDNWVYGTPSAQANCISDDEVAIRCVCCANTARPHSSRYYTQKRMFDLMDRTPAWADREAILAFYDNAKKGYDVDHIIPLNGDNVSGLHVIDNLQYLPAELNNKKANRY